MDYLNLIHNYKQYARDFRGMRYLPYEQLEHALGKLSPEFYVISEGTSQLGCPIKSINFGKGDQKILIWSQMHGNESTTTKAIFDALHILSSKGYSTFTKELSKQCTLKIVPMLNPDGSNRYTRSNANQIDLNRDAVDKSQKETQVFFKVVDEFNPHFCFNMHGQRTIFSAGDNEYPATMSFLAPAFNKERTLNNIRISAMQLIAAASNVLKAFIPNQIARYDDAFNENCFGDFLTKQGIPTILFEAGHFQDDYFRDITRQYVCLSLFAMLNAIITNNYKSIDYRMYFNLPENKKRYLDIIIKNINGRTPNSIGIMYKEECVDGRVIFKPVIEDVETLEDKFAHRYIDARYKPVLINDSDKFSAGDYISHLKIDGVDNNDVFIKSLNIT